MSNDIFKILEEDKAEIVELCRGRTRNGHDFHAFVQMDIETYGCYREKLMQGVPVDLNAFGKILHAGWGKEPAPGTCDMIVKKYTDNEKIRKAIDRNVAAIRNILKENSRTE